MSTFWAEEYFEDHFHLHFISVLLCVYGMYFLLETSDSSTAWWVAVKISGKYIVFVHKGLTGANTSHTAENACTVPLKARQLLYSSHLFKLTDKPHPGLWWLMTGFWHVVREKCCLPLSRGEKKTPTSLWLCWLLVNVSPVAKPLGRLCLWWWIRA